MAQVDTTPDTVKISLNLSTEVLNLLKQLAAERGTTVSEVLRDAISLEKYVDSITKEKGKLLFEKSDGKIREIVLAR